MALFDCCKVCVVPKRHPGCHTTCKDYIKDKNEFEKRKEALEAYKKKEYMSAKFYLQYGKR